MNPLIALVGLISFCIMLYYPLLMKRIAKKIPSAIVVLVVGISIATYCHLAEPHDYRLFSHEYHLDRHFLVGLPRDLFGSLPSWDWSAVATVPFTKYLILFTLVGSIESALTVSAVDTIDPQHRVSDVSRDLVAIGAANMIAGVLGGLPMISEVVRSKANVDAGAETYWSNFLHGLMLLVSVMLLPSLLGMIPSAALAGMLIFVGTRLVSIKEVMHMKQLGVDQLAFFLITLVLTVTTDILIGVTSGLLASVVFCVFTSKSLKRLFHFQSGIEAGSQSVVLTVRENASFLNVRSFVEVFNDLARSYKEVTIDFSEATLVEHSFLARTTQLSCGHPDCTVKIVGLDYGKRAMNSHPESTRYRA